MDLFDDTSSKYVTFAVVLLVGVAIDQWTKWYASERLATTREGIIEHSITVEVPDNAEEMTLRKYLEREFSSNSDEIIDAIARSQAYTPDGQQLKPSTKVEPGQKIVVENRTVTVIDGYWDFEYTVNPGAAFGLLSDSDSAYRLPFFIVVSLLAVAVILYLLRGVHPEQKLLVFALSLIGTGALGNFIDRVRFGHVVDFIVWKYGNEFRWPTFNVADSLITVGVALMLFEILRGGADPEDVEESESNGEPAQT